jgi:hypothetical protein
MGESSTATFPHRRAVGTRPLKIGDKAGVSGSLVYPGGGNFTKLVPRPELYYYKKYSRVPSVCNRAA